jgi:hypothetical protein
MAVLLLSVFVAAVTFLPVSAQTDGRDVYSTPLRWPNVSCSTRSYEDTFRRAEVGEEDRQAEKSLLLCPETKDGRLTTTMVI